MAIDVIARGLALKAAPKQGYFYSAQFYEDSAHTILITPEEGKIYIDKSVNPPVLYLWNGTAYVAVGGASGTSLYTTTITGDGTTTDFTITHNLNYLYCYVIVFDSNSSDVIVDVTRTSVNVYTIKFQEAPERSATYTVAVVSPKGPKGDPGNVQDVLQNGVSIVNPTTGVATIIPEATLKPMKSTWTVSSLTTAEAAELMINDGAQAGEGYLATVYWSDLSSLGMMCAEVKAFMISDWIVQFEMTSSDTSPYAWFFNSAGGEWRSYLPVINNTTSTSTKEALSANMGKNLQDQVNNLKNIGRFLSIWNASTGAPSTEPTESPYSYRVGDYYRVGVAGTKNPANNSTYTIGGTNWVEGGSLAVGDVVYVSNISGTTSTWVKQAASGGGTVQDVQVNGTSIVASGTGIANIPYMATNVYGLVKINGAQGLRLDSSGNLYMDVANGTEIAGKYGSAPLKPGSINDTIKSGLGNYTGTAFTDIEKSTARNTIGAATSEIVADWDNLRTL